MKNRITMGSNNSTFRYILERIESRDLNRHLYIQVYSSIRAKRLKQPKNPSTHEWISKRWHINTMEHYFSLKRKEIPTHASIGKKLEDIMLNEISQSQKDNDFPLE